MTDVSKSCRWLGWHEVYCARQSWKQRDLLTDGSGQFPRRLNDSRMVSFGIRKEIFEKREIRDGISNGGWKSAEAINDCIN